MLDRRYFIKGDGIIGLLNQNRRELLVKFVVESGRTPPTGPFRTNEYVERALNASN